MKSKKLILILFFVILFFNVFYFLNAALPIGTGYSAKYLCSHIFLQNRDPEFIFKREIKPTHILFGTANFEVDYQKKWVTTKAFGLFKKTVAVYREGLGCTLSVGISPEELVKNQITRIPTANLQDSEPYLESPSDRADLKVRIDELDRVLENYMKEPSETSNRNSRAILVSQNGQILGEKYSDGITETTPILGWSMTKSVINALVGILVNDGKLSTDKKELFGDWSFDERKNISLDNLLRMNSGLEFEEVYGPLKDATYMLYSSFSTSEYAMSKPLANPVGTVWYYSSGSTNLLSRLVFENSGKKLQNSYDFLQTKLLSKLKMRTAVLEVDPSGVIIGSSYMFASARDWGRFGKLFLNDGVFNGERILPEGWVKYSTTVTQNTPLGEYGAQIWLNRGNPENSENRKFKSLPPDLFYFGGYNKQIVAVIPSKKMVIVRLGVTTDGSWDHEEFLGAILKTIE